MVHFWFRANIHPLMLRAAAKFVKREKRVVIVVLPETEPVKKAKAVLAMGKSQYCVI